MTFQERSALLDRLFAAIEAGDVDAVREIYAPGIEVWHNTDGLVQARDENLRVLGWVTKNIGGMRYEEVRRGELDDGRVLQQHVLRGSAPNGTPLDVPCAIVFTFGDGQITRLEEYLDSGRLAALTS